MGRTQRRVQTIAVPLRDSDLHNRMAPPGQFTNVSRNRYLEYDGLDDEADQGSTIGPHELSP
jgi:hypothetical protein